MSDKTITYTFSYGFLGGPLHTRKFRKLMQRAGYDHTPDPHQADIVIAHSAGCWLIPASVKPKLIMYVGMPLSQLRPTQSLLLANRMAMKSNDLSRTMLTKTKTTFYGLTQPRRNLRIMRMAKGAEPIILPDVQAIFIANRHDPWPRDDKLRQLTDAHDWTFLELPGTHDDVWEHPERYVEILNYHAGLLAAPKQ